MKRVLSVSDLFAVGYGDLGSSIYYALGITAVFALGATPIALILAGFVFACTAFTYAEMSSMMREAGGSAAFSKQAFNDLISFIAGWGLLLDFIVTIAISSYSVAPYLSYFFPILKIPAAKILFTVCLIFVLFALNIRGAKHSTRLSWFLTILTVSTQVLILIIGIIWLTDFPAFFKHLQINVANSAWSPSWSQFWKGTAMAMVAYTGIESMAQLGSEAKRPARTVPRAMMYAMGTLILMYIGMSMVALSAMTPQELTTKYLEDPIAGIVASLPFGGEVLSPWIGILGAIILFVAANAGLMGASRLAFNMGENYQLPKLFYFLHKKYRTPIVSLLIFAVLASLIVIWSKGKLTFLADLYNFGAMLAFFSAHISLIMMRIKFPNLTRPFKIPFNIRCKSISIPISAIIGAVVTFSVWILIIATKPEGRYLGLLWLILGLIMYLTYRKKERIRPIGKLEVEKIKIPEFKGFEIKRILVPTRGGIETETVQIACQIAKVHKAEVKAIHIIEVPFTLPLHVSLYHRTMVAESILKRAEAIGREFGIGMDVELIKARSIPKAILDVSESGDFDLIVMGAASPKAGASAAVIGEALHEILVHASCRVWVCMGKPLKSRKY
ncbi:MAG: hypothetical protein Tsb0015_12990 [Simkaniaceae bacterium]